VSAKAVFAVNLFSDGATFVFTVLTYWQASAPATFITGVIGVIEKVRDKSLSKRVYLTIFLGVYLFFGFFLAWRDERLAVVQRNKEIETAKQELVKAKGEMEEEKKRHAPDFSANIDFISTGYASDKGVGQIFILLAIRNLGEPSIAENFKLQIKSNNLDIVKNNPTSIPSGHKLKEGRDVLAVFGSDENIADKTIKPIEHNGIVRGWLAYVVPEVSNVEGASKFYEAGTKYTVTFQDVAGNPWTATREITGNRATEDYRYPGATMPFKPRKKDGKTMLN
jgi:hypothetical protein